MASFTARELSAEVVFPAVTQLEAERIEFVWHDTTAADG